MTDRDHTMVASKIANNQLTKLSKLAEQLGERAFHILDRLPALVVTNLNRSSQATAIVSQHFPLLPFLCGEIYSELIREVLQNAECASTFQLQCVSGSSIPWSVYRDYYNPEAKERSAHKKEDSSDDDEKEPAVQEGAAREKGEDEEETGHTRDNSNNSVATKSSEITTISTKEIPRNRWEARKEQFAASPDQNSDDSESDSNTSDTPVKQEPPSKHLFIGFGSDSAPPEKAPSTTVNPASDKKFVGFGSDSAPPESGKPKMVAFSSDNPPPETTEGALTERENSIQSTLDDEEKSSELSSSWQKVDLCDDENDSGLVRSRSVRHWRKNFKKAQKERRRMPDTVCDVINKRAEDLYESIRDSWAADTTMKFHHGLTTVLSNRVASELPSLFVRRLEVLLNDISDIGELPTGMEEGEVADVAERVNMLEQAYVTLGECSESVRFPTALRDFWFYVKLLGESSHLHSLGQEENVALESSEDDEDEDENVDLESSEDEETLPEASSDEEQNETTKAENETESGDKKKDDRANGADSELTTSSRVSDYSGSSSYDSDSYDSGSTSEYESDSATASLSEEDLLLKS
eukprot:TRINITY_DN9619_c0_g1_i1.p1 TRINITY_DN9619_c0_g1~~TRINITY_DN9619_c0_g1_i1.p1  ORF type:complete len:623 (+),score=127.78 TRINITY_DN9619_c0_g1_i1:127-1869(+)